MLAWSKQLVLASAVLLVAVPAFADDETPENSTSAAPATLGSAVVKCPGGVSVPLTTDAEQALPFQLAGTLRCGEAVSVVLDNEGYTVRIRTQEGVEGYVARMYLAEGTAIVQRKHRAESAMAKNGVARWEAGAPGCDQFVSHGRHVESITANGITVQVSVQDTGWKYRVNVAVSNQGQKTVGLFPSTVSLAELQPKLRTLSVVDARKLSREAAHQVLWTSANAHPSPSAVAPKYSASSDVERSAVQDYMNPHMTLATARPGPFDKTKSVDVQAISLKPAAVKSGDKTAGVLWFERDANARELSLRVPMGDVVFDFAFAMGGKK
jgi:hypothetical protein